MSGVKAEACIASWTLTGTTELLFMSLIRAELKATNVLLMLVAIRVICLMALRSPGAM